MDGSALGNDVVAQIGARMRKAGVQGLPQNYALFYQAYVGANEKLRSHLETLGYDPPQDRLDELFGQYGAEAEYGKLVEDAHRRVMNAVGEIMDLLSREQGSLERYLKLLDSTASGMEGKEVGQETLQRIASILAKATTTTVKESQDSAESMSVRSIELQEIRRELETYKSLADTDHLTQLGNQRAFNRSLANLYTENRLMLVSTLVLLDIDRFKDTNDRYGHLVGDKVLQGVARIMRSECGPHVSLFRVGGEEFAMIVEGGSNTSTGELVEGIRKAIEEESFEALAPGLATTISAGICKAVDAANPDDLFEKTDSALYVSKSQGRNRVTAFPLPVVPKQIHERRNWLLYRED